MTSSIPSASATEALRPELALIGDGEGPLVDALRAQPGVVAHTDALGEPLDRIFTGTAMPDSETIAATLEAGHFVGIVAPTPEALAALYDVTATKPRAEALAVAVRKGDRGFATLAIADGETTSCSAVTDGPEPVPEVVPPVPNHEVNALALAAGPSELGDAPNLNAPSRATWGQAHQELHGSVVVNGDSTLSHQGQTQKVTEGGAVDYYVYYVDGGPGAPYYYVIQRIQHQIDPGGLLQNDLNCRGWSIARIRFANIQPPTRTDGSALGDGLTLVTTSPSSVQAQSVTAAVSLEMSIVAKVPGGEAPQTFTASEGFTLPIDGWTAYDESDLGSQVTSTLLCQTAPWSLGTQFPPNPPLPSMGAMIDNPSDDAVNQLPLTSVNPLTYYAYAVWKFDHSLIDPKGANGRGCQVQFHEERRYDLTIVTSRGGSNCWMDSAAGRGLVVNGGMLIDLGSVAVKTA